MSREHLSFVHGTNDELNLIMRAASEMRAAQGTERPVVVHTPYNLDHWSRTVRELKSGAVVTMMVCSATELQARELADVVDELKARELQCERDWESEDLLTEGWANSYP